MLERSLASADDGDLPALPFRAEPVLDRHAHVVEEDLGEHRAPVMFLIGRTVIPGVFIVDEQARDAVVLAPARRGSVRTSRIIHFAHIASDVQIFWPFTT